MILADLRVLRWVGYFALALSLVACSSWQKPTVLTPLPTSQIANAATKNRFAGYLSLKLSGFGQQDAQGVTLMFDLEGDETSGWLNLSTPFGTMVASVRWSPELINMLTPNGQQDFSSMDEMLIHVVGEPLPLKALFSWLKGQPDPAFASSGLNTSSASSTPVKFEQFGWWVDASELDAGILQAHRDPMADVRGARLTIRLMP